MCPLHEHQLHKMDFSIMTLKTYTFVYIFGGITFIPLVFVIFFVYSWIVLPDVDQTVFKSFKKYSFLNKKNRLKTLDSLDEATGVYKTGWIRVTREVDEMDIENIENKMSGTEGGTGNNIAGQTPGNNMSGGILNTTNVKKQRKGPALFFAVLKHGNLFLYDKENRSDVKYVIVLAQYHVSIYPKGSKDGELFTRTHAICLSREKNEQKKLKKDTESILDETRPRNKFLIYNSNPSDQEDWYFLLIQASKTLDKKCEWKENPCVSAVPLIFHSKHMSKLIHAIHSTDAQLETRWLNALLGRLFLGLYRTRFSQEYIIEKIRKKVSRIKKPGFLSDIVVKGVDIGDSIPYITCPRLRDLSSDGQLNIDAMITYNGNFRIEIATTATLNLGSRFKARQVELMLAVILKKFEGTLALIIKPPPSNRLWYGFYEMPKIDMTIEPIVFSKQITYSMILKVIENRIRETIHNTLVFPYMEDFEFYDTTDQFFRGGIWDHSKMQEKESESEKEISVIEKQESNEETLLDVLDDIKEKSNLSKMVSTNSENEAPNKSKHSILLTTLRSSGSEVKKNPLKRSSSYNTISDNSSLVDLENRSSTEIPSGDKSFKDLCGKSFVTAAAISAFGKSTVLPKTFNKISHFKTPKSEDISKLDIELDKKAIDVENESITSSTSTNSFKSSFTTKKERLSAAFATMRENTIFDNKRKSESGEKSSLSSSVSSATNTVRRWGANYIAKRHGNTSIDSESLNYTSSHTSPLSFQVNKKKTSSSNLNENPPDYSEISTDSIVYDSLQLSEPSCATTTDTVHAFSNKHISIPEPLESMTEQSYTISKPFSQRTDLDYDTLLPKQRPIPPILPMRRDLPSPPALPARRNVVKQIIIPEPSKTLDNANSHKTNVDSDDRVVDCDDKNVDHDIIAENLFQDSSEKNDESKNNNELENSIEQKSSFELDNIIELENTIELDNITEPEDTTQLADTSKLDGIAESENSMELEDMVELEDIINSKSIKRSTNTI
ncbi:hypothetical protein PNEG_00689 [Pneumocystis murina B123]|uniref:SMP-LTD domain-containing protein n=1 Tax=Pneumocystis murina (strain B123) TaxID=1069680 RepID=M7PB31_PNEMU|nr:hypothetical protein PNEG_00689 [Pneumocystis murina B123]EMR11090.1 hypothetical protein PNEG_00689 [Pneumocystis murina B123]